MHGRRLERILRLYNAKDPSLNLKFLPANPTKEDALQAFGLLSQGTLWGWNG
jgi:hypothetical protein